MIAELLPALSKGCGLDVVFREGSAEEYRRSLPGIVAVDLTETMLLVGGYSYYVPGQEQRQSTSDRWMVKGAVSSGLGSVVQATAPWTFE